MAAGEEVRINPGFFIFLVDSSLVGHVAYAVREKFFARDSSHPGAHGEHGTGHYAQNTASETDDRARYAWTKTNSVRSLVVCACKNTNNIFSVFLYSCGIIILS